MPDQDQNRLNEILKSLIEKQIIERREQNECALRVGAFSYSDVFSPQDPWRRLSSRRLWIFSLVVKIPEKT